MSQPPSSSESASTTGTPPPPLPPRSRPAWPAPPAEPRAPCIVAPERRHHWALGAGRQLPRPAARTAGVRHGAARAGGSSSAAPLCCHARQPRRRRGPVRAHDGRWTSPRCPAVPVRAPAPAPPRPHGTRSSQECQHLDYDEGVHDEIREHVEFVRNNTQKLGASPPDATAVAARTPAPANSTCRKRGGALGVGQKNPAAPAAPASANP